MTFHVNYRIFAAVQCLHAAASVCPWRAPRSPVRAYDPPRSGAATAPGCGETDRHDRDDGRFPELGGESVEERMSERAQREGGRGFTTRAVHAGERPERPAFTPTVTPIYPPSPTSPPIQEPGRDFRRRAAGIRLHAARQPHHSRPGSGGRHPRRDGRGARLRLRHGRAAGGGAERGPEPGTGSSPPAISTAPPRRCSSTYSAPSA